MSSSIAPTLYSRLACACNCAYGINTNMGIYTAPEIYDAGVAWRTTPKAFAASVIPGEGPKINACLVGQNQDGIVIAFRGTLPPALTLASMEDWWQDIADSTPESAPPLPGKVHTGFWNALSTLWDDVSSEIHTLHLENSDVPIFITGHSKGGPLATIFAARLCLEKSIVAKEIVTFASPHPGDRTFVNQYPSQLSVTRFENYLDVVPFLPPTKTFFEDVNELGCQELSCLFPKLAAVWSSMSNWDYMPLGRLQYVTAVGDVVCKDDYLANDYWRLFEMLATILNSPLESTQLESGKVEIQHILLQGNLKTSQSGLDKIAAAHCIACKEVSDCAGGYMTGAGGDPICHGS